MWPEAFSWNRINQIISRHCRNKNSISPRTTVWRENAKTLAQALFWMPHFFNWRALIWIIEQLQIFWRINSDFWIKNDECGKTNSSDMTLWSSTKITNVQCEHFPYEMCALCVYLIALCNFSNKCIEWDVVALCKRSISTHSTSMHAHARIKYGICVCVCVCVCHYAILIDWLVYHGTE